MEKVWLKVWLVGGGSFDVGIDVEQDAEMYRALPHAIANGIWRSETVFVPPHAIVQVEITAGPHAHFPHP
ncbi:MAG: hypothetical protein JO040_09510 [Gemmatimonadetes bacterium]|nr:hypothetical protein [Gemmatimonadota bacterium]